MSTEFTKADAIKQLDKNKLIREEGNYVLRVSHVFHDVDAGRTYINLRAMTAHHQSKAMESIKAGEFNKATNNNLSGSIPTGDSRFYEPKSGDLVKVEIEEYTNKEGIPVLGVARISEAPTKKAEAVSFASLLEDTEEEVEVADENVTA